MLGYLNIGYLNNSLIKSFVLSLAVSLLLVPFGVSAKDQIIEADLSSPTILEGESTSISITYNITDQVPTVGIGLRLHFDSTALSCDQTAITDLLPESNIGFQLSNDTDDYDNDASTDKYLNVAWASITGSWPSTVALPVTLFTLPCTAQIGFSGTTLKFSQISGANDFGFISTDIIINQGVSGPDSDGDGIVDSLDADDDNDGIPDDLEIASGRNPQGIDYAVGTGNKFSCALDSNGINCWGANQYGQRLAPILSNPTQLSVGFEHACAIDDSGVVCWGRGEKGETTPPVLSNPIAISAAKDHSCAIDDSGVVCWGSNTFKRSDIPVSVVNATQISSSLEHTCAIGDNGVECWGRNHKQQRKVPVGLVNPTQVSAGYIHSCAVDDNGVTCWGVADARSQVPDTLSNPTQVSAGGLSTCAIDDNGLTCWGAANIIAVPALVNPSQVSVGFNHACAQDMTGVVCWGNNDKGKRTPAVLTHITDNDGDGLSDADELLLGTDMLVSDTDGDSVPDGSDYMPLDADESADTDGDGIGNNADTDDDNDGIPDVLENETGRNPLAVDYYVGAGNKFTCAMDRNGVSCWGANQYGQRAAPVLSNPTTLSVGFEHACAIDDTGVVCWGRDHQGQATVPVLSNPTAIAASKIHTCALDDTGVVCWGSDAFKRSTVPASLINATQIDAGVEHSCAIGDNGVECWGRNHKKQRKVPAGLVNPTQVTTGYIHTCALDDNGVTCWGQEDSRIAVPALSNPTSISAGGFSTCAIDDNGVTCWGAPNIVNVPSLSNPTQLSVGYNHACAQDDTGAVCWGNDDKGKRTVPALEYVTDNDSDGVSDTLDNFPLDPTETTDSNGDGLGDNAHPPNLNTTSFTVSAPGASSVSMQASVYNWEIGRADSFASDNGDGTWTLIVDPSWTSQVDYKWRVDDIQEDFSSDYRAGECSSVYFAGYADTWFNRIWNPDRGVVTDDIAGTCIADDITGGGTGSSQLTMTVRADSASSVRITGPLWGWDVAAGPVATNNNNGTWSVILDPMPAEDMEYLWVIDGIQENLISNAANAECSNEINSGAMVTDYFSFTNRQWIVGSGEISGAVANACSDSVIVDPQPQPTVLANVLSNGIVDNGWDVGLAAFDSGQDYASCYNDNGAGCPNVSWSLVSDSERGDVLQVSHADTGIYVGMYFASSAGRDFSAAANGNLVFDIKSVAGDSNFVAKVDCVYPCASNNIDLGSQGSAGWQTVSIPVSTLTSNGLDLTSVSTGLVIWPVAAANTVYQLDNIRWEVQEGASEPQVDYTPTSYSGYSLAWSDEFNGSAVNKSDWTFETGRGSNGWGNQESQFYREENTTVANGLLTIEAKEENFNGAEYTSSRLITRGKQSFKYGRIDVRAKLPQGQGLWPAIWMLGERFDSVGWPASGEIDIMEMIGGDGREDTIHGTIHYADNNGSHQYVGDSVGLVSCQAIGCANTFADAFHTFSIEWDSQSIKWLVDGVEFASQQITSSDRTEFHEEFFFIMNVAVGGQWPGYPDNSTSFPQQMQVDYVRVYQPTLSQFSFLQSDNPGLSSDINLSLENGVLSGRAAIGDSVDNLVASFQQAGESISIDGIDQSDGVTSNDFSNPLNYTIVGNDGLETTIAVDLAEFTGLPIVNINTLGGVGIDSKDDYVLGTVSVDGGRGFTDFPELAIEIRGRGNSTWGHPKKPYQMKFEGKEEFLDMPKDKKWIFLAEYSDKTLLRNRIAFEMGYISDLDWTPESTFAEVFINNQYNGTYNIVQKVEETNRRVALGDTGYLLEIDQIFRLDPDDVYFETGTFLLNIKEPSLVANDAQFVYIRDLINNFETALFGSNFMDPTIGYASFIDLPSFIDWYLISEITKNVDSVSFSSIYLNVMPNEKIKMGPLWDFDLSFGNVDYADSRYAEGFWIKNNPWYSRLFQDPAFVALVQDRFAYFRDNQATMLEKIDTYATQLKWAQQENNDKWQTIGSYVWPNPVVYDTYQEEVDHMKDWYVQRMNWLDEALGDL